MEKKDPSSVSSSANDPSSKNIPAWKRGPHGIGDPDDRSLRKVEKEVTIPMKMRERGKEKCVEEVRAFNECCKDSSIAMVVNCRNQNFELKACLTKWYQNEDFKKECTEEYLAERSEYRRTGLKKKQRKYEP